MQDYKKLTVWRKSHSLVLEIYKATSEFPKNEMYGLTSQIRRACTSIPTNIAEGCGRGSQSELSQFLRMAQGSASELEYQLLLIKELGFYDAITYSSLNNQLIEVRRMLTAFISRLNPKTSN